MTRFTIRHLAFAFAFALALLGSACCPTYGGTPGSKTAIAALSQAPADDCELRLYIEHTSGEQAGVSAFELSSSNGTTKATAGVCIKHQKQALSLPSRIVIASQNIDSFGPICEGGAFPVPGVGTGCVWNHHFRNRYPFSFTFLAKTGVIKDYIELARVYRNGSLIARYNTASQLEKEQVLTFRGEELEVPNSAFVAHPPHLAALDLRILPAGAAVDESILNETVVDYAERAKARAKALSDAALGATGVNFKQELSCASQRIARLKAQAEAIVDSRVAVPSLDAACQTDIADAPNQSASLSQLYADEKAAIKAKLVQTTTDKLQQLSLIRDALPKIRAEIEKKLNGSEPAALAAIDREIDAAAKSCDDTLAVAQRLRGAALDVVHNRETQARIYEASVAALEQRGSVFEQYVDNPAPLPDELRLDMEHSQRFQWFMFAPWNGVPVSLAPSGSKGQLQLASAIPLLDVVGFRVQFARSRFADLRVAIGGMYFRDKSPETTSSADAASSATTTVTANQDIFHGAVQGNVGIATFKFGVAWVPGTTQLGARNWAENELRLLVGTDLLKLISGTNVEAL